MFHRLSDFCRPSLRAVVMPAILMLGFVAGEPLKLAAQTMPTRLGAGAGAGVEGTDFLVVTRARFQDRMGFERPVEAFSVLLPKGWKRDGGVQWGNVGGCRGELIRPSMKASSPDGKFQFEMLPVRSFNATDDQQLQQILQAGAQGGGCQINRAFSAEQYVDGFARRDLGAKAASVRTDEGRLPMVRQLDEQANGVMRQYVQNGQQQTTMAYGDLTWPDGTEGILHSTVTNVTTRQPNYATGGSTTMSSTMASAILMRFPGGRRQEGARMLSMIMASHRVNPVWQEAKSRFLTQLGNMEHAANMDRIRLMGEQSRAYAEAQNAASEQRMRSWERRQESDDRQHRASIQAIREVETWKDSSGSVELAAGYEHAWSRGDGSYLLSNKPGFDPAAALQDSQWKPMQRER